jgi:hypothetical protein
MPEQVSQSGIVEDDQPAMRARFARIRETNLRLRRHSTFQPNGSITYR